MYRTVWSAAPPVRQVPGLPDGPPARAAARTHGPGKLTEKPLA